MVDVASMNELHPGAPPRHKVNKLMFRTKRNKKKFFKRDTNISSPLSRPDGEMAL
jgi:hypothetical protein